MKQRTGRKLLGILLSITLMLGLMPGLSLTAYADGTTYDPASMYTGFGDLNTNDTEVTISEVSGKTWYVIANDSTTVTLLSKQSFGEQPFNSDTGNDYATSDIKIYVDGLTEKGQPLAGISSVISDLTLIDLATALELSVTKRKGAGADWWLCSPSLTDNGAAFVYGGSGDVNFNGRYVERTLGVRPALKLKLSSVIFSSESNTFSLEPSHTHSFSYTASGATITATCSNTDGKCTLDDGTAQHNHAVSLTLSATDASYTGSAYTGASLSDTAAWTGAGLTAPTVEYAGRGTTSYTKSTTAPTAAGTYTASITAGEKTATKDFTISPMALTIDTATATNRTYDKDNTAVTISGVTFKDSSEQAVSLTLGENNDYTVTGTMTDANAGDGKTVNVTVTLINGNYSLATTTTTTTVNIDKADAVPSTVTANNHIYDGTEKPLVTVDESTLVGGTMWYALGTATEATQPYSTSVPSKTDVGTYYVWYKVEGDDNHNDVDPKCVTAVITEPTPMVTTSASVLLRTMTVNWTKDKSVKNYKVAYRKAGSSKWTIKKTSQPGYVVWNQKTRECYEYKVAAVIDTKEMWSDVDYRYFNTVSTKTKAGKGTITVSWGKDNNSSGYQIMVATYKNMKDAQIINVESTKKSYVVSGLKKGKTYYVRVRPMKLRGDVTYVGILSNTCKVKVK